MTLSSCSPLLAPSKNCWRVEAATRLSVIIDADAYFRVARATMLKARRRIMMIGWDFDAGIVLDRARDTQADGPQTVGEFIHWLVENNADLEVYLLRWDVGALRTLGRGRTIMTLLRWMQHPRIHLKLDGHHPTGASHHQKIVVIDDSVAFCGGIDMTGDRWDTREHFDDDPRRPYKPWHDATTAIQGPAAAALGTLCRDRWKGAGGGPLAPVDGWFDPWPEDFPADFRNVSIALSRTYPAMADQTPVCEIEALYLDLIAEARRFIYAESQYFASRKIAEAIARRLDESDGPEIVIVNPRKAHGWIEPLAMDTARARLVEALQRRDRHDRFKIYHPVTTAGEPIYVHAKILIVDDRILRVGSSNLNNRSMRLDTECDVTLDAATEPDPDVPLGIASLRNSLMAEHLGVREDEVAGTLAATGSLIATVEHLRRATGRSLRPYEKPALTSIEAWLADNEVLDPEGPEEMFEPLAKRGLFRRRR